MQLTWADIIGTQIGDNFKIGDDVANFIDGWEAEPDDLLAITGISTDSRSTEPGDLYIALKGERFDGHAYVKDALAKGAVAAIVDKEFDPDSVEMPVLGVTSPQIALGSIARAWRRQFSIPVVGVTGSVGKTTTKEMIACALSPLGLVLKTAANENNEIGLPKTLLRITDEHKAVVVEMGMRGRQQIAYLAGIAEPTIGIITVIGESHIELLGSRVEIAAAKAELFEALPTGFGTAIFNIGDEFAAHLALKARCRKLTFGETADADYRLTSAERDGEGWAATATTPTGATITYRVQSPARHDTLNALSAIVVANVAGVLPQAAADAVGAYIPGSMRMETVKASSGATILSDCYNAAPTSMRAALDTLASYNGDGRRIAIIGDMRELGDHAPAMHAKIAHHAAKLGIEELYVVGEEFGREASNAVAKFASSTEAAAYAHRYLATKPGDVVLVKGSRAMAMEKVVEALTGNGDAG